MSANRLERLSHLIKQAGLDAVVINPGPSLLYLTGLNFHLMERPTTLIVVPDRDPGLVIPELELGKLKTARLKILSFPFGDNPRLWDEAFFQATAEFSLNGKKIGVEPTRLRYLELSYLQKAAPLAEFVSAQSVLGQLRLQKDAEEIRSMRKAAEIAQAALDATLPIVKPGISEREIASELSVNLLRCGSESELPFPPIVASGPNTANPHAVPSDRKLQAGDLLLFDWGASTQGYFSDITRTFAIGHLSEELGKVYQAVKDANKAGKTAGKPGVRAGDVDHAARGVIQQAGYEPYFTHRTGHGLGMESHEEPYMFSENDLLLQEGMVFTVEPGIYLPGVGGVRIEDDILITPEGHASLTDYPRELTIL